MPPNPPLNPDLTSLPVLSTTAPPTLTLQLPFILLGTRNLPTSLYSHAKRRTRPLETVLHILRQFCPDIAVGLWVPREFGRAGDEVEVEEKMERERGEQWTSRRGRREMGGEKSQTEELAGEGERRKRWEVSEEKRWRDIRDRGWIVRLGSESEKGGIGWVGDWVEGDGVLTERERRRVGEEVWSVPVLLQRFGVGFQMREDVLLELGRMFGVLKGACRWDGNAKADARVKKKYMGLRIVCNERCLVKMKVESGTGRPWNVDMVGKTMLLLAGCEREMAAISSMSEVLQFSPVSRFLTHYFVRRLQQEKRGFWRAVRGEREEYEKEKAKWERDLQVEDLGHLIDEPELWTMVDELWNDGSVQMGDMVREMERCSGGRGRLATSFPLARFSEGKEDCSDDDGPGKERAKQGGEDGGSGKEEDKSTIGADKNDGGGYSSPVLTRFNRSTASTPEPPSPEPFPEIESIIFQSHRSSINAEETCAYIDLVTQLISYACTHSYTTLRLRVQSFRAAIDDLDEPPPQFMSRLCTLLGVQKSTHKYYKDLLGRDATLNSSDLEEKDDTLKTPFDRVIQLITEQRNREAEYMPTYISRYASAGGFHAVSRKKLYALMVAEEESRRQRKIELGRRNKQRRVTIGRLAGRLPLDGTIEEGGARDGNMRLHDLSYEVGARGLVLSPGSAGPANPMGSTEATLNGRPKAPSTALFSSKLVVGNRPDKGKAKVTE